MTEHQILERLVKRIEELQAYCQTHPEKKHVFETLKLNLELLARFSEDWEVPHPLRSGDLHAN